MVKSHGGGAESLLELYDGILSCSKYEDLGKKVLAPVARHLEADTGCFLQFLPTQNDDIRVGQSAHHRVHPDLHALYTTHFFRIDPAVIEMSAPIKQPTNVFLTSEICDYGELMTGELYNDFLRPNHIHHIMVLALRPDVISGERLILGFHRPRATTPFEDEHKNKLRRLTNVLSVALRGISLQEAITIRDEAINEMEDAHPQTGIAFFDDQLSLMYGNEKALRDLQISAGEFKTNHYGGRMDQILKACSLLAARGEDDRSFSLDFKDADDLQMEVRARKMPNGRLLFAMHSNTHGQEARLLEKCAQYGITRREMDIVRLLGAGMSNTEIAARLFRSVRTVENHLRSIYAKTGVNRRTQLLSRLR